MEHKLQNKRATTPFLIQRHLLRSKLTTSMSLNTTFYQKTKYQQGYKSRCIRLHTSDKKPGFPLLNYITSTTPSLKEDFL